MAGTVATCLHSVVVFNEQRGVRLLARFYLLYKSVLPRVKVPKDAVVETPRPRQSLLRRVMSGLLVQLPRGTAIEVSDGSPGASRTLGGRKNGGRLHL